MKNINRIFFSIYYIKQSITITNKLTGYMLDNNLYTDFQFSLFLPNMSKKFYIRFFKFGEYIYKEYE